MQSVLDTSFFLTGTGTGVGKTHAAAGILYRLAASRLCYWKPVQTGDDDDRSLAWKLSELTEDRFLPTSLRFREPLSPHRAAELEGRSIDVKALVNEYNRHAASGPLLIEGAGGILVPLTRKETWLDFVQKARLNVIVAAWTGLGTINHSLLTLRTLAREGVTVAGVIFCGPENQDNRRTVLDFSGAHDLGSFHYTGRMAADTGSIHVESLFGVDSAPFPSN